MYGCFQDRTDVFIILRYEANWCLENLLRRHKLLTLDFARSLTVQIILGLQYLHGLNIAHGDLKPENILLDKNFCAHVADFGLSRNFYKEELRGK